MTQLVQIVKITSKYGENIPDKETQKDLYKAFKMRLPSIRIAGTFSASGSKNLLTQSGYIGLDIDNLTTEQVAQYTTALKQDKYEHAFWLSVSKKGFFIVVKIRVCNV